MHPTLRTRIGALALVAVVSAGTTALVLPRATAQSTQPAPQLVQGLPDFTNLVSRVGPAVVNIEAVTDGRSAGAAQGLPDDAEIPEIFRRFFGPGMPFPMPPGGSGGGTSLGSGFIISADGYVLTNHHVIAASETGGGITVSLPGEEPVSAEVVATDVNRRALWMTRLNAALNEVAVDVRAGSLYEPVARYSLSLRLPGGNEHKATISDVLSHRLGIFGHANDSKLEDGADARWLVTFHVDGRTLPWGLPSGASLDGDAPWHP